MKVLIGIGDSWTQGEGGVPHHFFEKGNGRIDLIRDDDDPEFLRYEHENSWVNRLCVKYFKDHTPINLGMRGYGNRGAVKNLYYHDIPHKEITGGYLIFVLSSRERFDFLGKAHKGRRRFMTLYPHTHNKQYLYYYEYLYSEFAANQELMFNIIDAQNYAKVHGLEFFFAYAFDNASDVRDKSKDPYNLSKQVNWGRCLTPNTTYMDILCKMEGIEYDIDYIKSRPHPLKYLTNCLHPTIDGYDVMCDEIYNSIIAIKEKLI